jgi:alkyldihydroxyacetonephosphate synthase
MVHISHVYENGANLYFTFLSPMQKGNELEEYIAYHKGIIETIQANNGSLSHHHGVGRTLAPWMEQELGTSTMELMQAIKDHLDPNGIMNPGNTLGLKP